MPIPCFSQAVASTRERRDNHLTAAKAGQGALTLQAHHRRKALVDLVVEGDRGTVRRPGYVREDFRLAFVPKDSRPGGYIWSN